MREREKVSSYGLCFSMSLSFPNPFLYERERESEFIGNDSVDVADDA